MGSLHHIKTAPSSVPLTAEERSARNHRYMQKYLAKPGVWMRYLLTHARIRNEKHHPHTIFDLDETWLNEQFTAQEGKCFWLGVPMRTTRSSGPWQVSLDRLDLEVGYCKTNVVLTSQAANLGRRDAKLEDFELFLHDLKAAMLRKGT